MTSDTVDLTAVGRERELIGALLHEGAYPHPVDNLRLLDTHISWVILTGSFAYKIKKPIKLEFLDFSSLEQRRHYCEEELRLNRRWAQDLYLDIVPITGNFGKPVVEGAGDAIEYAVKMKQFPQSAQLDAQLDAGLLMDADMIALAERIAAQHGEIPVCTGLGDKQADQLVRHPMLENIKYLQQHVSRNSLQGLSNWTAVNLKSLWPKLLRRQDDGFVRECHGDLHLENLVRLPSGISAFDCVEFNAELRNIDVISDVSFLVMDLISRQRQDLAYTFLNRYLECTGDYEGVSVFGLYYVYHALIRAKIAAIHSIERSVEIDRQDDLDEMADYCSVARHWTEVRRPCLVVMHGFSGSGKTWLSQQLLARLPAIRVRSDIERKRRHGLAETESSEAGVGQGIYDPRARSDVYESLAAYAAILLQAGQSVIADASFLNRRNRQCFRDLAQSQHADFVIVDAQAEPAELERRLRRRLHDAGDASEADSKVLQYQYEHADALDAEELLSAIVVATDAEVDASRIVERIVAAGQRGHSSRL